MISRPHTRHVHNCCFATTSWFGPYRFSSNSEPHSFVGSDGGLPHQLRFIVTSLFALIVSLALVINLLSSDDASRYSSAVLLSDVFLLRI